MASITLPIGGQAVDIPIPDFAMEDTQRQVLAAVQAMAGQQSNQAGGLQAAASDQKAAADKLDRAADELEDAAENVGKSMRQTVGDVSKSLMQQERNFGEKVSNLFSSMRLTALGGVFGSAFAVLEEFAGNAALLRRAGAGLGENFTTLRDNAANVGLSLGDFSKIVLTNSKAMTTLGTGVQNGSNQFTSLVANFQSAIEPMGSFGMSAAEIAEYMAEELEIRRQQGQQDFSQRMTQDALIEGMKENLRQQEAMANLTGTDVRERIKAQRAIQGDAVMQSYLSEQSEETRQAFRNLTSELATVPGGEELMNALMTSIATGLPPATFAPKLVGMLQGAGLGDMQNILSNIMSGGDSTVLSQELVQMVRDASGNLDQSALRRAAVLPNELSETARTLLTFKNQIVEVEDVQTQFNERLAKLSGSFGGTEGMIVQADKATQSLQALAQRAILAAAGLSGSTDDNFNQLLQSVTGFTQNDITRDFVSAMGTVYGTATGSVQLTDIMGQIQRGEDIGGADAYTALLAMANSVSPAFAQNFLSMEGVATKLGLTPDQARLFGPETILALKGVNEATGLGQFDSTLAGLGFDQATINSMKDTAQSIEAYTLQDLGNQITPVLNGIETALRDLKNFINN